VPLSRASPLGNRQYRTLQTERVYLGRWRASCAGHWIGANWVNDEDEARWAAFPLDAVPRPTVLLDHRVRIESGFDDSNSKEAWQGGRIGWSTPLPPAVS
jgi:hypothetical protein